MNICGWCTAPKGVLCNLNCELEKLVPSIPGDLTRIKAEIKAVLQQQLDAGVHPIILQSACVLACNEIIEQELP